MSPFESKSFLRYCCLRPYLGLLRRKKVKALVHISNHESSRVVAVGVAVRNLTAYLLGWLVQLLLDANGSGSDDASVSLSRVEKASSTRLLIVVLRKRLPKEQSDLETKNRCRQVALSQVVFVAVAVDVLSLSRVNTSRLPYLCMHVHV